MRAYNGHVGKMKMFYQSWTRARQSTRDRTQFRGVRRNEHVRRFINSFSTMPSSRYLMASGRRPRFSSRSLTEGFNCSRTSLAKQVPEKTPLLCATNSRSAFSRRWS
ncbi:hypothetical protein F444_13011 [Phytophthora nicotianae P1976]|uniref:Uncharacterized protein n=1 Tax=Phytophthora nicotianae P1976 TaxID=1317066 RepID=A0A080ZV71_PHYNI|nr:hypothetical protein F444_13011 [Phytophthora nicotianae P1976]